MFDLREFVLRGIKGMIDIEADYKVIKYALGWYDKDVLTQDDLSEINLLLTPVQE